MKQYRFWLTLTAGVFWLWALQNSDAYYEIYVLIALAGTLCAVFMNDISRREKRFAVIMGLIPALCVAAAEYRAAESLSVRLAPGMAYLPLAMETAIFLSGWQVFFSLSLGILKRCGSSERRKTFRPGPAMAVTAAAVFTVHCTVFFCKGYPGVVSPDTVVQLNQIFGIAPYTNHHPYYHTLLMKYLLKIGLHFFRDYNIACAGYCLVQMACMALAEGYAVFTLCRAGVRKSLIILTAVLYALLPFQIYFSFSMWKDILFSGAVLVLVCGLWNVLHAGRHPQMHILVSLAATAAVCLLRNNGMIAFCLFFILFLTVYRSRRTVLKPGMAAVLGICIVLEGPVLAGLGVKPAGILESLAIPGQQLARVVAEELPLTNDEQAALDLYMDREAVAAAYDPGIFDRAKEVMLNKAEAVRKDLPGFFSIWWRLLRKYPETYVKAWIDQTRGFWNAGYEYEVWYLAVMPNLFELKPSLPAGTAAQAVRTLTDAWCEAVPRIHHAIGLAVWIMLLYTIAGFAYGRRSCVMAILPLSVVLTLLAATPVYCEFRYAYCVFLCLPSVLAFCRLDGKEIRRDRKDGLCCFSEETKPEDPGCGAD